MPLEECVHCGTNSRKLDEDGRCPVCHELASEICGRLGRGEISRPGTDYGILSSGPVPQDPSPRAGIPCSACRKMIDAKSDSNTYRDAQGREFYYHGICWKIQSRDENAA